MKSPGGNLNVLLLHERIQPLKPTYSAIPSIWYFEKDKIMEKIKR